MQAVALALVACAVLWAQAQEPVAATRKRLLRILWVLLAIYLLSPIVAGAFGVLVMLMV